jgi:perosamine synthetase
VSLQARRFAGDFANFLGVAHARPFWKGRVALYAILKALGVESGDEVILPGYTCVMNVNPIKYVGATPVYVDIEPECFNIDPAKIEEKVSERTRLIIAQHTYGYPCDMESIMSLASKHRLAIVEDCCLSLGSRYGGRWTGTFGAAGYFSFQWNKPFTTGLGGMAVTNDDALAHRIDEGCRDELEQPSGRDSYLLAAQLAAYRGLVFPRTTALVQSAFRQLTKRGIVVGSSGVAEYAPEMPAGFFRGMSDLQARSGLRQLAKLDANIAHRKKMARIYDDLLHPLGWTRPAYDERIMDPVLVRYPVRVRDKARALQEAASAGVELGSWFECPLHPIETPMHEYGYTPGLCPEAELASQEVVNLPLHPRTDEATARRTVRFIERYLG